jgi:N-acetylglucosamine-6-sulfatase
LRGSFRVWLSTMTTRGATRIAVWSCLGIFLLGISISSALGLHMMPAAAATRPNLVVIMTDDQTVESLRVMPKTLRLIGAGTTFSNSFVSLPWCCPSRSTYLTGQYPHNHGVWTIRPPDGGYDRLDHGNTLPLWLQEAGYYTSHIGKYLNGYGKENPHEIPPGWSDWQGLVDPSTYKMYGYTINDNGALITYGGEEQDYQTDVLAARAEDTIAEAAQTKQPFFLSIAPVAPHLELRSTGFEAPRPAPRHFGTFAKEPLPRLPSLNEPNVSDKPTLIRNLPPLTQSELRDITDVYRARLAALLAVDDMVERIVTSLTERGVLDNTVLLFTSDNGFLHGEHRIERGKRKVYEESVRVPLLIRGGGFPQGATATQFVANIDLAPTIVQLAGANARLSMDGRPLLRMALDPNFGLGRNLLIETLEYQAVRNESFLYVEHTSGERELYDMRSDETSYDPFQLHSRHADRAYHRIEARLGVKLSELRTCSGSSCRAE